MYQRSTFLSTRTQLNCLSKVANFQSFYEFLLRLGCTGMDFPPGKSMGRRRAFGRLQTEETHPGRANRRRWRTKNSSIEKRKRSSFPEEPGHADW